MQVKRHPALYNLSCDHQLYLEQARFVRWYLADDERSKSLDELITTLLDFWRKDGEPHLQEEEIAVYPAYLQAAPTKQRDINALLTDHQWLRERVQELENVPRFENASPLLRSISDYMINHVRHEETVTYEAIQDSLTEEQLQAITENALAFRKEHRSPESIHEPQAIIELPEL